MGEDRGDVDAVLSGTGLAGAAIRIEQTYLQAPRRHHAMEMSGTVARWAAAGSPYGTRCRRARP